MQCANSRVSSLDKECLRIGFEPREKDSQLANRSFVRGANYIGSQGLTVKGILRTFLKGREQNSSPERTSEGASWRRDPFDCQKRN